MLRFALLLSIPLGMAACNRCEEACPTASTDELEQCRASITACDLTPVLGEFCATSVIESFELSCDGAGSAYTPVQGPERSDARCGPEWDNAVCNPDRCCSTNGWCGGEGESHCSTDNGFDGAFDGP